MTSHEFNQLPVLLKPCQVKELLNISQCTYDKLVDAGTLRFIRIEGTEARRFLKADVLAILQPNK